jgi:choline dehydrogenase-like flavoprotein
MPDRYDIIIIGTGAGGGTLARRLAPSGKRILILERGRYIPREAENWDTRAVFSQQRYQAKEPWFDSAGNPFSPYTHYCVGGNTKVYGAALLRMRPHDFNDVRHYGGLSPAWPIGYDDLEPYYTEAERLYTVHGARGRDPHDPPASAPYPFPALAHEPRIAALERDLTRLGYRPFPIPIAIRPQEVSASRAPIHLARFDGYPDPTETKSDSHVCGIAPALDHPNVTLLTGARAERLLADGRGREVTGVVVDHEGQQLTFSADVVVLACGAINSAALLLRSASERHPHGLANSSGQVGRNYMCHHNGLFIAVMQESNPSTFQKTLGLTDFYRGSDDSEFPLGTIQLMGKPDPDTLAFMAKDALPGAPIEEIAGRTIDVFLTAEDLPHPDNRVALREDGSIQLFRADTNAEAYTRLEAKLKSILDTIERSCGRRTPAYLTLRLGIGGVSHQCGTLRFGTDPRASVLDTDCKAHDLTNLYIADASFFPSSSAVNPSLTIMAKALRVGDRILERLGATHSRPVVLDLPAERMYA